MSANQIPYKGEKLLESAKLPDGKKIAPYIPNEEIKEVVRLMRLLKRPLLIQGEPGSGKTLLAQAVAYELYGADFKDYYFEWNVKSTSKAKDGLYSFDHLSRLRDAQIKGEKADLAPANYIKKGPVGKAFEKSTEANPAILLIDEIDKADIDFPNDLLLELDQLRYEIEEISDEFSINVQGEKINRSQAAKYAPIVFITSNEEKELPPAFLRRCLYHYITFPDAKQLTDIVNRNFPNIHFKILEKALGHFLNLRDLMKAERNTGKMASTGEFIDFVKVIVHQYEEDLKTTFPNKKAEEITEEDLKKLPVTQKMEGGLKDLHYPTLIKTLTDYKLFVKS